MKPTIVLVRGAYAESASWSGVLGPLQAAGHRVIAFATPLRGVASDAALLSDLVNSVDGPVPVEIAGASHVVGIARPAETARIILEAADSHARADA